MGFRSFYSSLIIGTEAFPEHPPPHLWTSSVDCLENANPQLDLVFPNMDLSASQTCTVLKQPLPESPP